MTNRTIDSKTTALCLFVVLCFLTLEATADENAQRSKRAQGLSLIKKLGETRASMSGFKKKIKDIDVHLLQSKYIKDVSRKREALSLLKRFMEALDDDLHHEQKRTCALNLGGHCATESAASITDQWHFLNSALSPGRKRRDTGFQEAMAKELN